MGAVDMNRVFVGTAGWTIPKQHLAAFPTLDEGAKRSHLERYATLFHCVEVNSSFHRPHRRASWERWAATIPDGFRFAVKAPKIVTHSAKLIDTGGALLDFFDAISGLGNKLGPVLIQLPPKLDFDDGVAREFFMTLREIYPGQVVCEPRHPGWFSASADRLLRDFEIACVAVDPPKACKLAARPGGWPGVRYWRLHGSPQTYYSNYAESWLRTLAHQVQSLRDASSDTEFWVILDNTAVGHATANAAWMSEALK
jgi:uncharacterized protein YecE (DUF72 family)